MRYFAKPNAIRFKGNVVFCETQRISLPEKCFVLRNPSHFSSRNMPCFAKPNAFLFKDNAYVLRNPTQPFKNSFQKASNLIRCGHKPKKPGRIWGVSKTAPARKPNAFQYLLWPKNEVILIEREIDAEVIFFWVNWFGHEIWSKHFFIWSVYMCFDLNFFFEN